MSDWKEFWKDAIDNSYAYPNKKGLILRRGIEELKEELGLFFGKEEENNLLN